MMRRGGRGSIVQSPRRGHDGAIPSALHLDRGWGARNYVKIIVLAVCSIAISIIFWSLRSPGLLQEPHVLGHYLRPRNSGFVFPLYRYYQQYPNASHRAGGHERWRGSRVGFHGRGILSDESEPLFELLGGHRRNTLFIEQFYIEMKLGDPPKPFYFHIDTGSGRMWVYCTLRGHQSTLSSFGPNGLFVTEADSHLKCIGATASLCRAFQAKDEVCDKKYQYVCFFSRSYAEGSTFSGYVVNGSITLPMCDETERNVFGLFGCVVHTGFKVPIILQPLTDGIIGLGNCKGTLMDQLFESNAISQNLLGVCMAKGTQLSMLPASPRAPVGYISLGMDFKEKFNQHKSDWVKLIDPGIGVRCAYAAKLLYISLHGRKITITSMFLGHETAGMAMLFDTGSDLTYLPKDLYGQVLNELDTFASDRAYFRVPDNTIYSQSEQRVCWKPPATKLSKSSPIYDFGPLKLGFEGMSCATKYLIIRPVNYLTWDENERKVCVNILIDPVVGGHPVSNLGAEVMRENLFVFDVENQRVRWTASSNCEI
ncbi:hypothetical protein M758_9G110500 [Ceratodon purpureus]|uniref:Peptidase A1 domain-containing protein n=1 Tax=Ceratodon purpureus TaxID=3225 RepID=A0A8T0GQF4_CERPU|nr:hypothetical protein KC19_9G095700 [Ceratodon purpureus]KAG0606064.1 hypothetical protein M758_9G110500 [Ceratodon purpureus]